MSDKFFKMNSEKIAKDIYKFIDNTFQLSSLNILEKRMNAAMNLVYLTARTKRPDIKIDGRKVSSPSAEFGVPVRSGKLKDAIKKNVGRKGYHIIGRVFVSTNEVPYAKRIELGYKPNQAPRPFLRPAWDIHRQTILDMLHKPLTKE